MLWSKTFIPTLKEPPKDAEIASHQLLLRAGLIRKLAGGVYTFLPLGLRAYNKVEQIVREEMNRAGAIEVLMPALSPKELWQRGPRWDAAQHVMFAATPANGSKVSGGELVLGPTHEEVITSLVADHIRSYRDLPRNFYQIQTKFRNEIRPRFGLMRCKEFVMKDAYSFDADEAAAVKSYEVMRDAYKRIFERCGFPKEKLRCVLADTGVMGGSHSQEFLVPAEVGECEMARCEACGYGANIEKATARVLLIDDGASTGLYTKFPTPNAKTIEDLTKPPFDVPANRQIKTLVYMFNEKDKNGKLIGAEKPILLLLRGDHQLGLSQLTWAIGSEFSRPATDEEILGLLGARPGSLGAIGDKKCRIVADKALQDRRNMVTGANEDGFHYRGVDVKRDIKIDKWVDLRLPTPDDICPNCEGKLQIQPAIELGHIFILGTKYAEKLGANFLDERGQQHPCVMGCYGIGVTRTLQAVVEVFNDAKGIQWPMEVAPFQVVICALDIKGQPMEVAQKLHDDLEREGIEVLLDDRDERPGVKFNDAELIGIPLRITIGAKSLTKGEIELRERASGETISLPVADAAKDIVARVKKSLESTF